MQYFDTIFHLHVHLVFLLRKIGARIFLHFINKKGTAKRSIPTQHELLCGVHYLGINSYVNVIDETKLYSPFITTKSFFY